MALSHNHYHQNVIHNGHLDNGCDLDAHPTRTNSAPQLPKAVLWLVALGTRTPPLSRTKIKVASLSRLGTTLVLPKTREGPVTITKSKMPGAWILGI